MRIEELRPTQAAIGYDQIFYKLGRWQGDFERATWAADPALQLDYLNRTVGKKFDDYCEDMGGTKRAQEFQSIVEARAARLDQPDTFTCLDAPGTHAANLKTVVVGWDGNLYLTDGHHTFSSLREIFDGGATLPVWVKVDANYSDLATAAAFWQRMVDERRAWLRDGQWQDCANRSARQPLFAGTNAAGELIPTQHIELDPGSVRKLSRATEEDWSTMAMPRNGLCRLQLSGPRAAFGHTAYPVELGATVAANARTRRPRPLPNPPYTPVIERLSLSYEAASVIALDPPARVTGKLK